MTDTIELGRRDAPAASETASGSVAERPRSDTGTIVLHWLAVILVVVSLLTGLRIAADTYGAVVAPALDFMLPNGEVWTFHVFAGLSLFACASAYVVYVFRAAVTKRNSPKRIKALTMNAPARYKWQAVNVALHWLAYLAIALLAGTGTALYIGFGGWIVPVHRYAAFFLLAYIFIHTLAHFMYGGLWQLLRLFRPAPLARSEVRRAFPFAVAAIVGVAAAALAATLDLTTRPDFVARATATPPTLDGRLDDEVWKNAAVASMRTQQGQNMTGLMESTVEVRAAYDDENIYFAFRWNDPTRSLMRLPLRKEADGWHVVGTRVGDADVMDYYEDKLAILFTSEPAFGGGGTTHMGVKPLDDKPSAANKRGLHYTLDGTILDLWQWKAARGGMLGYVDDMYIGPPIEPNEAQAAGKERYSAGYLPDPGQSTYVYNFKARSGVGYAGPVDVLRLPVDYQATLAAMKTIPATPAESNEDGAIWWMTNETSAPYSQELDDAIPVGTMMPGVLNINEYQGDRADLRGGSRYEDGYWTLETVRKRETGSKYDIAFRPGQKVYIYLSVFDHVQTRHTRHERPVVMEMQ